jgi:DNA-binding CsgD family transcriptional regulator
MVDDDTRRRMRLIAPHIRRAVMIGRTIDIKTSEAATFADTFDGLAAGMFLVGADGHIIHANGAGYAFLTDGGLLRKNHGRLVANNSDMQRELHKIFAAAGRGDLAIRTTGIALPLAARTGERHVVHVLPLASGARRRAGKAYAAVAAVFVYKAELNAPAPAEIIAQTYRLTPTELRVLLAIVEIGGTPEAAEALGIADTTVKTHLGRIYAKTGARRHADLVKLIAEFSNPLVG